MDEPVARYGYGGGDDREFAGSDRHTVFFVLAVVLSLLLHAALGWAARGARLDVPGGDATSALRRKLAARTETSIKARIAEVQENRAERERPRETVSAATPPPLAPESPVPGAALLPPPVSPEVDPASGLGAALPVEAMVVPEDSAPEPWSPRVELLEIASRFANDDLAALPRLELPEVAFSAPVPDFPVSVAELPASADFGGAVFSDDFAISGPAPLSAASGEVAALLDFSSTGGASAAPQPAPLPPPPDAPADAALDAPAAFLPELPEEAAPARPLDDVLAASVSTYRPASDDGFLYFRIDIRRKGPEVLPPIPRDIVFAVDVSRSIAPDRVRRCAQAFQDIAAVALRPDDRFEALAFNSTNRFAFGGVPRAASPAALGELSRFFSTISPDGNTDLYGALHATFAMKSEPGRARVVLLASDGVPTTGEVRRDSEIIGRLSAENAGETSVFGAGIARKTDEFLLSMLSLCNRGDAAVLSRDRYDVAATVREAFDGIGTPVLSGIRFVFNAASGAVVAPAAPGNLRLERPLSLWGRVPLSASRNVLFEARGENGGRAYDMVFDIPLGDPTPGSGNPALAAQWARARLYDLVAAHVRSPDAALRAEMATLGARYRLPVPFAERLQGGN